jgi:hypothetical protein
VKLRKNNALKFFAILLFSFELLAPSLFGSTSSELRIENDSKLTFAQSLHSLSSFFLLEERNEEEREGKDILFSPSLYPIYWFTVSQETKEFQSQLFLNRDSSLPQSLFKLHCTFLI